jgi:hypothetical protein
MRSSLEMKWGCDASNVFEPNVNTMILNMLNTEMSEGRARGRA